MAQPVSLLLLGEADVGKSSLIQRFSNPSHQVRDEGASLPVRHFWSMSPPSSASLETTVDGLPVSVSIDEVPASRGRSSNISQIATRSRTADCVLFCFSLDKEWSARSLNTYLNVMNRARTPQQIPQRGVRLQRSRVQQAPAPSPAEAAPARVLPPVVLVQLKSEKNPTSEIGDAMAREHGFPLIKVSVKDNLNVTEVLELAVRSALHKRTPAPAPASAPAPALPKEVEISEAPAPVVEVAAVPAEKVSMKKRKKQADDQLRRKSARLAQEQQSAEDTAQDDKPDVAQSA